MHDEESLVHFVKAQSDKARCRFSMPGHKGRLDPLDVTEAGEMDNLLMPRGALMHAHARCAKAYGAKSARFCVNGSTAGVMAMLCSKPLEGKQVLLSADCHLSAAYGLVHSGALPILLPPRTGEDGISLPCDVADVASALSDNPAVAAVLIESPNYYGFTADVPAISALCRERNIPLWVDAAHGAHFGFSPSLPPQPVQADDWVVSAHKTLPVPNQGALLLCGKDSLSDERQLFDALASFMTTSPSWPLLCAIDSAVADLVACAAARYDDLLVRIARFARSIDGSPYRIIDAPASRKDPTRLLIDVSKAGQSGFKAAEWLASQGIWVEMADERRLVLITTPGDTDEDFSCLADALAGLPTGTQLPKNAPQPPHGEFAVSPRCAAYGTMSLRELSLSVGCIAARAVCAYPPGCAVVLPGEIVTKAQTDYLCAMQAAGASLIGVEDGAMYVLE